MIKNYLLLLLLVISGQVESEVTFGEVERLDGGAVARSSNISITSAKTGCLSSASDLDDALNTIDSGGCGNQNPAASDVTVETTGSGTQLAPLGDNVQSVLESIQRNFLNIPSGTQSQQVRSFIRENTDLSIGLVQPISQHEDINTIYAAGVNKNVVWRLPTEAQITSSGEPYPVTFEFTHLGGLARNVSDFSSNRVEVTFQLNDTQRLDIPASSITGAERFFIFRGDVAVVSKAAAGQNWQVELFSHTTSSSLLPSGVFELQEDTLIQDVTNIETELQGVSIRAGDAYEIVTGGVWFGSEIRNGSVIIALEDGASLDTSSTDWLILENGRDGLSNDEVMFFNNITRTGTRFDLSDNIFVDPANVLSLHSSATGLPVTQSYSSVDGGGFGVQKTFPSQPIQFADLRGGTLTLSISFDAQSFSGFLPDLTSIDFDYGSGVIFSFPLSGIDASNGATSVSISIPNQDYSLILNTDPTVTLNYTYRGASFVGSFTIMSLTNRLDGTLRPPVVIIAEEAAMAVEQRVNSRIQSLAQEVDNDGGALSAIQPRISPLKEIQVRTAEINARFADSNPPGSAPPAFSGFDQVSSTNPQYRAGSTEIFIAAPGGSSYILKNTSKDTEIALAASEPTVDLLESLFDRVTSYFVYRVSGILANDLYEVDRVTSEEVPAWPDDIKNLQGDVSRIDAELQHAALDLDDAVIDVLDNSTDVVEESSPVVNPTEFNEHLAGPSNTTQTVFKEANAKTGSGGTIDSAALSDTVSTARYRNKLVYFPDSQTYSNQTYVTATDGSTTFDLISYRDGVFSATSFVPAIPASTQTQTVYPKPANQVLNPNNPWFTIEALTFQGGVPVAEASELFFTRDIPTSSVTLDIFYRGHANGNPFGAGSTTLSGVGGSSQTSTSFTLNDGSEAVTVEVTWLPSSRRIRVSEVSRVNAGLPTVNDIQVRLEYTETRQVPATPATTREVRVSSVSPGLSQVFALKPDNGNVVVVGNLSEVNTGYSWETLFGSGLPGNLTASSNDAVFFDYQDFQPIPSTITSLENQSTLTQFGLFSTTYTHQSILDFGVRVRARTQDGTTVNLGEEVILPAPNGTRWRLGVDNSGSITTTEVN